MKRLGLMGCGFVSSAHLRALAETADLELVALYDPNPDRVNAARPAPEGVGRCTDLDTFWASDLDAVVICSPAPCHRENVLDAAAHGVHVLCEKPLAMDEGESREMIGVMQRAGLMLCTAYCYRFSSAAQEIRSLVNEGAIGDVRSLRLIYNWNMHGRYEAGSGDSPRLNPRRGGRMEEGGPMVDCGVHQIDLARWWLGSEAVGWESHGAWVDEYEAPDHMYLHMDHANGAHTTVEISYSYCFTAKEPRSEFVYELIGTEGVIRYDRSARVFEVRSAKGTQALSWAPEKGYARMYAAFAKALATGVPGDMPTGEDGLIATRIARRATEEAIAKRQG